MKKRKHCFIAIMLTVSILVGIVPVYVNADNTSVASSQEVVPVIGNNTNVIPESNETYDNMHDFRLVNSEHTPGYIDLSDAITGDTWAFSTTVNLEMIMVNYGPCITIARGKKSYDDPSYLRLSLKQYNNTSQCVLFEDETSTTGYTKGITVKTIYDLEKLQTGVNYQVTMQICNRELLKCWVNGQLIAEMNLKELGFTDITPCFGWRCAGSTATFTGCKMWEDSASAIPTIGNNMNVIPESNDTYDNMHDFRLVNSEHTPGYIDLSDAITGDTWAFSTTINLEMIMVNYGPCITIARGKKSYDDPSYLRLSLKQYNNTSQCVLFEDETSTTGYTKGKTVKTITDLEKLQTGVNYQVTMQIRNRELLQCWVNGQLIAEMNLKELGFTDITPCFGWRCAGSTATFAGCKMWENGNSGGGNSGGGNDGGGSQVVVPAANDLTFDNGKKVSFGQGIASSGSETYVIGGYTLEGEDAKVSEMSVDVTFSKRLSYQCVGVRFGTLIDNADGKHALYFALQQTQSGGVRWGLYADGRADTNLLAINGYSSTFNLENVYTLKMSCEDQILSVSVDGSEVLRKNIPDLKKANGYEELVIDKTELIFDMAASMTNVKLSGTGIKERMNLNTMTNGTVTIACDNSDLSKGTKVIVVPQAEENYNVVAGTLKYTIGEAAHCINNLDEQTGGHVFTMPEEDITLCCEFSENNEQNISIAVIGASLEKIDENSDEYKGIRFLIRMGLPDTTKSPIGQKVVYEGKEYTIKDYGTLSSKVSDYETKGDEAFKKVSQADIFETTQGFADYMVAYREVSDLDEEYVVKGYVELDPAGLRKTVILETEPYRESIASTEAKLK